MRHLAIEVQVKWNSHYQSSWTNTGSKTETVSLTMVKSWWGDDSWPKIIKPHVLQSRLHWLHISIHFLQTIQASTKTLLAKPLLCSQTPQVDLSENIEFDTQIQFWGYIRYISVYHGIPHLQIPYHSFCHGCGDKCKVSGATPPTQGGTWCALKLLNHRRSQFVPFSCSKIGRNQILRIGRIGSSRFCKLMGLFLQGHSFWIEEACRFNVMFVI